MEEAQSKDAFAVLEAEVKDLRRACEAYRLMAEKRKYELQVYQESFDRLLDKVIERIK